MSSLLNSRYVHTNLIARDWKRLVDFYTRVFGCVIVPPERDLSGQWLDEATNVSHAHLRGAHLRLPGYGDTGPTLEIFQYDEELDPLAPATNRPGYGHIAFLVDDVDAAHAAVIAAGGKAIGKIVAPEIAGAGKIRFVYVADPEGNIIELQKWIR
ncbi:MAG: VOC family protein [Chloroflexi bacterium]|nr:VOC family protein [Chloroflexota bacterium]